MVFDRTRFAVLSLSSFLFILQLKKLHNFYIVKIAFSEPPRIQPGGFFINHIGKCMMRYLSVCSGIEAATVAWHALGWQAAAFSEIDEFPRAVLAHHYPDVPLHGDFTTIKEGEYGSIDLLVGGTPCQSFSIAGLRKGLDDDRGNLALEFIRLAQRLRPRWLVWENVPGVLSIDGGRTFGTFLGGLAECGYGFAYRVLDAQYFGVPQRRRRVFVVGYLGDWRPAAAVLFESESLHGDITPSREARKRIADSLTVGANQCSGFPGDFVEDAPIPLKEPSAKGDAGALRNSVCGNPGDPMFTLKASGQHGIAQIAGTVSSKWAKGTGGPAGDECQNLVAHTLRATYDAGEDGTGRGVPLVADTLTSNGDAHSGFRDDGGLVPIPINMQNALRDTKPGHANGVGIGDAGDPAFTLQAGHHHAVAFNVTFCDANGRRKDRPNGGLYVNEADQAKTVTAGGDQSTYIAFMQEPNNAVRPIAGDGHVTGTICARHGVKQQTYVAKVPREVGCFKPGQSAAARGIGYDSDVAPSLEAGAGGNNKPAVLNAMAVRRLTPRECERLQGFPDDYTLIPLPLKARQTRQRWASDAARYKALGNSMAVPVMRWIGERIEGYDGH